MPKIIPDGDCPKAPNRVWGKGWISGEVAYSPDGALLAVASSIGIWLYDANSGAEVYLLSGHTRPVFSVAFSPDGSALASSAVAGDNTVRLWDIRTGDPLKIFEGHANHITSVAFSPDGLTLAAGDGKNIRLWDVRTGERLRTLRGIRALFYHWRSRPTAARLLAEAIGTTTRFVCGTPARASPCNLSRGTSAGFYRSHIHLMENARSGDLKGRVRLWDVRSGNYLGALDGQSSIHSIAFSSDGTIPRQFER